MAHMTDPAYLSAQFNSRRSILLVYILIGTGLFVLGIIIDEGEFAPASFMYMGAIVIAFIFLMSSANFPKHPTAESLNSLRNIMYLFIIVFVVAVVIDVAWWEALYYTTFLGIILAVSGFFIMNQMITDGQFLLNPSSAIQPPTGWKSSSGKAKGSNFCPNCGDPIDLTKPSKFCQNCGQEL